MPPTEFRDQAYRELSKAGMSLDIIRNGLACVDDATLRELVRFAQGKAASKQQPNTFSEGSMKTVTLPPGVTAAGLTGAITRAVEAEFAKARSGGAKAAPGSYEAFSETCESFSERGDQLAQVQRYAESIAPQCEAGGTTPGRIVEAFRGARRADPSLTARKFLFGR